MQATPSPAHTTSQQNVVPLTSIPTPAETGRIETPPSPPMRSRRGSESGVETPLINDESVSGEKEANLPHAESPSSSLNNTIDSLEKELKGLYQLRAHLFKQNKLAGQSVRLQMEADELAAQVTQLTEEDAHLTEQWQNKQSEADACSEAIRLRNTLLGETEQKISSITDQLKSIDNGTYYRLRENLSGLTKRRNALTKKKENLLQDLEILHDRLGGKELDPADAFLVEKFGPRFGIDRQKQTYEDDIEIPSHNSLSTTERSSINSEIDEKNRAIEATESQIKNIAAEQAKIKEDLKELRKRY